jgi:glucosamine--fructose-6-phosphate aminotransferase (isomerizing)
VKHAGAWAVGVTANPDSRLGKAVNVVLNVVSQDSSTAPGTASYCASLVALYLLAIRIAEVRMRFTMDVANGLRQKLAALGQPMLAALAACEAPLAECAESWADDRMVDVLGSGPGAGAAAYTAAKLVEAAGVHASYQDLEEFFHLNYFVAAPESVPAVVFAPSCGAGASRATELLRTLGELGRPCLVISDSTTFGPQGQVAAGQIAGQARVVALPPVEELLTPLLGIIPAALLAAFWADRSGAEHYRGHSGPWRSSRGAALVRGSLIELNLADAAPDRRRQ